MRHPAVARSARSRPAATLPPTRAFDLTAPAAPAAPGGAGHDLSRVAISTPSGGREGAADVPIQRVVMVNGKRLSNEELEKHGGDKEGHTILSNWHNSEVEHDFKEDDGNDPANLRQAVARARAQAADAPDLYSAKNLSFLTKHAKRQPTLYFKSQQGSAHLRQQHKHGPQVGTVVKDKTDYFFKTEKEKDAFHKAAKAAALKNEDFDPSSLGIDHLTEPKDGYYHYEVAYSAPKKIAMIHPSGGQVVTNVEPYKNDDTIKSIYKKITGKG